MAYGTVNADIITTSTGQTLGAGNATAFKNRIINGAMTIDQRNSGASFTNSNTGIYGLDRWLTYGVTSGLLTIQRSATAPAGFINSQSVTITTSTTANDGAAVDQYIEGNNVYDLNWGTSSGSPVTVSFWVRSSIAGVYNYYVKYFGSSSSYYYITPYTISSANTWQYITLTISPPPSAAGAFTAALNTTYMDTRFVISSSGSTANGTANTWSTTIPNKISGSVDLASNSGATFYITGVQLEVGTQATSFDYRDYGRELMLCQRYYEMIGDVLGGSTVQILFVDAYAPSSGSTTAQYNWSFKQQKRTTPTVAIYGSFSTSNLTGGLGTLGISPMNALLYGNPAGAGRLYWYNNAASGWYASAEL
jgi:hypothetical protein